MNTLSGMPALRSVTATSDDLKVESAQQSRQVEETQQALPGQGGAPVQPLNPEEVDNVVVELNSMAQNLQRDLLFSVDDKTGDTIIKVTDRETEEVLREIPSAEIRAMKARLQDTAGVIFKDSV